MSKVIILLLMLIHAIAFSQDKTYYVGPRGGCYYINSNGNKTYVDHSYCKASEKPHVQTKQNETQKIVTNNASASSRSYYRGPKGGCYYLSNAGKKVYVDRSMCD